MKTIENCKITLFNDGSIAFVTLPSNPDYETMMKLGKGKPCHYTILLSLQYELHGMTYYLSR